jgi:hypothetical protein
LVGRGIDEKRGWGFPRRCGRGFGRWGISLGQRVKLEEIERGMEYDNFLRVVTVSF